MRLSILMLIAVVITCLPSCRENSKSKTDPFYTHGSGYDYISVPFIKPYEALRLNGSKEWGMNLYNETLTSSVFNIKEVNIVNQTIFLYSTNCNLNGEKVKEAWFVIIPSGHIEQGFATHNDYINFLNQHKITTEPKLFDIDFISNYFDGHHPLNWEVLNKNALPRGEKR